MKRYTFFALLILSAVLLSACGAEDTATAEEVKSLGFKIITVKKILPIAMGAGERETISLAKEQRIENVLIDDEKGF